MTHTIAPTAHLALAWLLVAGLAVQIFLAGLGVFAGAENFATHRDTGYLLGLLPIVMAVAAAIGRLGRRQIVLAVVIFALFMLQSVFVALRHSTPAIAALHPVNGFLIAYLAIGVARGAWERRSYAVAAGAPSLAGETP